MITQPQYFRLPVNLASQFLKKPNLLALEAAFWGGEKRRNNSVWKQELVRKLQKRRVESGKTQILNSHHPKLWGAAQGESRAGSSLPRAGVYSTKIPLGMHSWRIPAGFTSLSRAV